MIPVKAAVGALVRHPHTRQALPQIDGEDEPVLVDENEVYWARLIRDEDVIPVVESAPKAGAISADDAAPKARASSSKGDRA